MNTEESNISLRKFFRILLGSKFQTFLTIVTILASGGLVYIGKEAYAAILLAGALLGIFFYSLFTTWSERKAVEMEHFRDPLFIEFSCFTEQISLDPKEQEPPLSSRSKEVYILRNRSQKFPVKQTKRLEDWIDPESKGAVRFVRTLTQEEAEKFGYKITKEAECAFRSFTSPIVKEIVGDEWKIIFSSIEFKEPLLPGETIGLECISDTENVFQFEDFYIYQPELPTKKARIELIAPSGYSISLIDFSVVDAGNNKALAVMDDLKSKKQIPLESPTKSSVTWEIENPILIYNYRVDFKIEENAHR